MLILSKVFWRFRVYYRGVLALRAHYARRRARFKFKYIYTWKIPHPIEKPCATKTLREKRNKNNNLHVQPLAKHWKTSENSNENPLAIPTTCRRECNLTTQRLIYFDNLNATFGPFPLAKSKTCLYDADPRILTMKLEAEGDILWPSEQRLPKLKKLLKSRPSKSATILKPLTKACSCTCS